MSESRSQSSLIHTILNIYASKTAAHNSEPLFYVLCLISQRNHLRSASFRIAPTLSRWPAPHSAERVHLPVCARRGIVVILITVNSSALQSLKLGLKSRCQWKVSAFLEQYAPDSGHDKYSIIQWFLCCICVFKIMTSCFCCFFCHCSIFIFCALCLFFIPLPLPVYKTWWLSIRNERIKCETWVWTHFNMVVIFCLSRKMMQYGTFVQNILYYKSVSDTNKCVLLILHHTSRHYD